jgi:ATP-dependent DNA ligase
MIISDNIYSKDSKGVLRFWRYLVDGDKWTGVSGQVGGAETQSGWTHCVPKSKPTSEEQALFEANAEMTKKLDRKYRKTVDDLEKGDIFIQPMLAHGIDDYDMPLPYLAQPKLDGFRCIITAEGATTRQGQPFVTIDHILADLAPVFEQYPDLVLDGELYNHDYKADFNTLSSLIRKDFKLDKKALKAGVSEDEQRAALKARQASAIQYHVYDIVDSTMPFEERIELIEHIFLQEWDVPGIFVVETCEVTSDAGGEELYIEWLEQGFEGLMKRNPSATYQVGKRSKHLLKWKDFETKEFKVARIEEGNGNWKGAAKRVVVYLEDGRENESGTRGSIPFLKGVLEDKERYEAGWVTVRFMKQRTPDGKLRAPVTIDYHPEGRKD